MVPAAFLLILPATLGGAQAPSMPAPDRVRVRLRDPPRDSPPVTAAPRASARAGRDRSRRRRLLRSVMRTSGAGLRIRLRRRPEVDRLAGDRRLLQRRGEGVPVGPRRGDRKEHARPAIHRGVRLDAREPRAAEGDPRLQPPRGAGRGRPRPRSARAASPRRCSSPRASTPRSSPARRRCPSSCGGSSCDGTPVPAKLLDQCLLVLVPRSTRTASRS